MRRKIEPLLCELHAHTRWSDGALTVSELVDLYGRNGFDVLCVTDHVNRSDDPWLPADAPPCGPTASSQCRVPRGARRTSRARTPGIRPAAHTGHRADVQRSGSSSRYARRRRRLSRVRPALDNGSSLRHDFAGPIFRLGEPGGCHDRLGIFVESLHGLRIGELDQKIDDGLRHKPPPSDRQSDVDETFHLFEAAVKRDNPLDTSGERRVTGRHGVLHGGVGAPSALIANDLRAGVAGLQDFGVDPTTRR